MTEPCDRVRGQPSGCPFLEEDGTDRLARIETRMDNMESTLGSIDRAVRGHNGTPGIKTDVELLKAAQARRDRLYWIMIGAMVATLLKLVVG